MKYIAMWLAAVFAGVLGPALGGEPGAHYTHLKVLEPHIGHWRYEGTDGEGRHVTGEETAEWIFNKNFMRTVGTWHPEGTDPVRYELITGWDPVRERIVMGAPLSDGGHLARVGSFDDTTKTWRSEETSVDGKDTSTRPSARLCSRTMTRGRRLGLSRRRMVCRSLMARQLRHELSKTPASPMTLPPSLMRWSASGNSKARPQRDRSRARGT